MADIIKCKDCKYLQSWRTPEQAEKFGQEYECSLKVLLCPSPDDYCSKAKKKRIKYMTVINTDDYKDFKFFEDADGKYLVARDAGAKSDEWITLHFTEVEIEEDEE